jgi:hypothetical protein
MFVINDDQSICLTRGDIAVIQVSANNNEQSHVFKQGDKIRLQVYEAKKCDAIVLKKEVEVENETATVEISLNKEDTKIGEIINTPATYWYEIELNPDTAPQTIVGYDSKGAKIFKLFPEGADT